MGAEEQKQTNDAALLEYRKMRERRVLLENEAESLSQAFEALVEKLRSHPETLEIGETEELSKNYGRLGANRPVFVLLSLINRAKRNDPIFCMNGTIFEK